MKQYLTLLDNILKTGTQRSDRTGVGTYSIFGYQMRFNLQEGFPLVTTKKCHFHSIVHELLWFLKGDTNIAYLKKNNVNIWNAWADKDGNLGPIYGKQWRSWDTGNQQTIDQIKWLLHEIKNNPDSRRMVISAWNPSVLPDTKYAPQENARIGKQALPPCHCLFQFYVHKGMLSCQLYQRSADVFLGVPFNIASYALLTFMIAQVCKLKVGEFIHTFGDVHLYANHEQQAQEQLTRLPFKIPKLKLNSNIDDLFLFQEKDIELQNYQAHPHLKGKVAI